MPDRPNIRYIRLAERCSIGAKRNLACQAARGDIIAHWDDDDWYAPRRLSIQTAPILRREADITGLVTDLYFDLPSWQFWRSSAALHRRMFVGDVHGGTLVFRREVWQSLAQYPDTSLAEDADFLHAAVAGGAHLARIDQPGLFIYLRHGANAWAFRCGEEGDAVGWERAPEPVLASTDRDFYRRRSSVAKTAKRQTRARRQRPQVSCLMPTTSNRRPFIPQAIRYFQRLDDSDNELLIVDDGDQPIDDLVPEHPRIRYLRLEGRRPLGEKRNLACQEARGDLLMHWDDDDWYAPWRIGYQVSALRQSGAEVVGLAELTFYDPRQGRAWLYRHASSSFEGWLAGSTLCFTRALWQRQPFVAVDVGEDNHFVWQTHPSRVVALRRSDFAVAVIHGGNSSPKHLNSPLFQPLPVVAVQAQLGEDRAFYDRICDPT